MTSRELAEKILLDIANDLGDPEHIESLLSEALEEAQIECIETHLCHSKAVRDAAVDEARAAAYEEGFVRGQEKKASCLCAKETGPCGLHAPMIDEAYEEGFTKGREQGAFECRHAKDIALEEAAKVAEDCPDENYGEDCHESIPRRIRALKAV